jgi:uncharacterized damage-inducible protein DinB
MVTVTGIELVDWVQKTSEAWKKLIVEHPKILSFACDIRESKTVAQLLQHVVGVELRYAERLNSLPETPHEAIQHDSVEVIYATHDRAMELLLPLLDRDDQFWETVLEMKTRSAGALRATRKTTLVHLLTHSVRHYAQLATLVRREGVSGNFAMDYILMHAEL